MVCPFCLHKKTEVYNSRKTTRLNRLWRRRRCLGCNQEFTTYELIDIGHIIRVGNDTKKTVPFSKSKLLLDLAKVCDHRQDDAAYWLAETIEQKLLQLGSKTEGIITKTDIRAYCLATLKLFDATAFVKYLSYHEANALDVRMLKHE